MDRHWLTCSCTTPPGASRSSSSGTPPWNEARHVEGAVGHESRGGGIRPPPERALWKPQLGEGRLRRETVKGFPLFVSAEARAFRRAARLLLHHAERSQEFLLDDTVLGEILHERGAVQVVVVEHVAVGIVLVRRAVVDALQG